MVFTSCLVLRVIDLEVDIAGLQQLLVRAARVDAADVYKRQGEDDSLFTSPLAHDSVTFPMSPVSYTHL